MNTKLSVIVLLSALVCAASADPRPDFYKFTCPNAESIIKSVVQTRFQGDRSVTAALLRMNFHDCFVRGCDASILLDSIKGQKSEKQSGPNLTVRGFELIEEIKAKLEAACPSTVSCADIIQVATRDAVALSSGINFIYQVETGRRDGVISLAREVNLPGPSSSVDDAFQSFAAKNMTMEDMVTLLGAHTVGVAHCGFFTDRLSDFQGTGRPDPSMNTALRNKLVRICNSGPNPTAFLDQNTSFVVDNEFYNQIAQHKGVLEIDQRLAFDGRSASLVRLFAQSGNIHFLAKFANSMVKMGRIDALVGKAGQIRKRCNVVNPRIEMVEEEPSTSFAM